MKLGCIVMAAGASRRFGENKLLKSLGGLPLYRRALEAVPQDSFAAAVVVTCCAPMTQLAETMGFSVIANDRPELGISRTIRLGLEALSHCDGVLFMTADQPLLTKASIRKICDDFREDPESIVCAAADGVRGNPCLFPRSLFPALLALEGDRGGSAVIKEYPRLLRLVPVAAEELADADTAEELASLEACLSGGNFV